MRKRFFVDNPRRIWKSRSRDSDSPAWGEESRCFVEKVNLSIEKKSYGVRESIRTLRTNLQFCGDDKRVILVTSCVPREGKSSVSVALAESIADMGKSVILVDADIRNSVMASKLQITGADKGLSHFLSGQCVLADVIMATNIPKFHILLSGRGSESDRASGIRTFYWYAGVHEECL